MSSFVAIADDVSPSPPLLLRAFDRALIRASSAVAGGNCVSSAWARRSIANGSQTGISEAVT
jgi:hypothetical protein